jgi:hypothetical protein
MCRAETAGFRLAAWDGLSHRASVTGQCSATISTRRSTTINVTSMGGISLDWGAAGEAKPCNMTKFFSKRQGISRYWCRDMLNAFGHKIGDAITRAMGPLESGSVRWLAISGADALCLVGGTGAAWTIGPAEVLTRYRNAKASAPWRSTSCLALARSATNGRPNSPDNRESSTACAHRHCYYSVRRGHPSASGAAWDHHRAPDRGARFSRPDGHRRVRARQAAPPDPLILLGSLVRQTARIEPGTCVVQVKHAPSGRACPPGPDTEYIVRRPLPVRWRQRIDQDRFRRRANRL